MVFILVAYRALLFTTFDEVVLAATVLATMNVMGVTLIAATLVVPAVVARMMTDSFSTMLVIATVIGAISGFVGMNASYHLDLPSGSTIVLVGTVFFVAAFLGGGRLRSRAADRGPSTPGSEMSTPQAALRSAMTCFQRSGSLEYGA